MDLLSRHARDARFAAGILARKPFQVLVQVTNRCNMRCSFCDFWPNPAPPKDELSVADFVRVADELAELGCFLVSIEGGEPLARPDLVEIVRAFGRHHLPVLFTNGWFVDETNARALWDAGLAHASVSIDYPDAARHDKKRGLARTTDRAWSAVEVFERTAPRRGRQVHVMTVLMEQNHLDMEQLFRQSARAGVGHQVTLISESGYRRGKEGPDRLPPPHVSARMCELFDRYEHVRFFREYFERIDAFLAGGAMPECRAGLQSFNLDHVGNVSPCIERIDEVVGNVKDASIAELYRRLAARHEELRRCQDCWTACRGFNQSLGKGGTARGLATLATRMRA
ncbi:MAG: radical SAM protein [Myxococcales bacterium]|nr:radical SAM protein [Myxococcales bacterium]